MSTSDRLISELAPEFTNSPSLGLTSSPFLASTFHSLHASASNATHFLNGSRFFDNVPRWLSPFTEGFGWLQSGGSVVAEATGQRAAGIEAAVQATTEAQGATASVAAANVATEPATTSAFRGALSFQHIRNMTGVLAYLTSKWALTCFILVRQAVFFCHWGAFRGLAVLFADWSGYHTQSNKDLLFGPSKPPFDLSNEACSAYGTYTHVHGPHYIDPTSNAVPDFAELFAAQIRRPWQTLRLRLFCGRRPAAYNQFDLTILANRPRFMSRCGYDYAAAGLQGILVATVATFQSALCGTIHRSPFLLCAGTANHDRDGHVGFRTLSGIRRSRGHANQPPGSEFLRISNLHWHQEHHGQRRRFGEYWLANEEYPSRKAQHAP